MESNICIASVPKEHNQNNGTGFNPYLFPCLEKNSQGKTLRPSILYPTKQLLKYNDS